MNHLKPGFGALVFRLEPFGEFGIRTLVSKEGPTQRASVELQGFLFTITLGACWIWLKPVKLFFGVLGCNKTPGILSRPGQQQPAETKTN